MYLDVKEAALMLKKLQLASVATALASIVFPFPGGPKRRSPRAGDRSPSNKSGLNVGNITGKMLYILKTPELKCF